MKKDKLKEYYGTQRPSFAGGPGAGSNFYSGKDLGTHSKGSLGTRGADSNFSRRMQALVPDDYYDLNGEEFSHFVKNTYKDFRKLFDSRDKELWKKIKRDVDLLLWNNMKN